ncbi:hypothetical protein T484DRAFT_3409228 [Baffinella frigidus]|nr:hypothetical protein T484DRAFT_3409228 [Cryptophyta sp. CCMP2293]
MGVSFLERFVRENRHVATRRICLSELAAQRAANGEPRLQLFLDGTAFLYSVLSDPALGPCWEWAIGGEFGIMAGAVRERVQLLHAAGIDLVFTQDPAHGATDASDDMNPEKAARFEECCHNISRLMSLLSSDARLEEWEEKEVGVQWKKPNMASDQLLMTLEDMRVPLKRCVEEADVELAEMNRGAPGSFVVGKDSDFCIMQGVAYLPLDHFGVSARGIHARLITNDTMLEALGLTDYGRLPELAFLCGNDISKNLPPADAAAFLRRLPRGAPLASHPDVAAALARDQEFAHAFAAAVSPQIEFWS